MDSFFLEDKYHIPRICLKCSGVMIFQGVGEYRCEDCGELAYDDYGKVRAYIEEHRGANATQIEAYTGVSQRTIRQLLKDGRLEVSADSRAFLHCELCGKAIRYGQFCQECEASMHRSIEEKQRQQLKNSKQKNMQGFSMGKQGEDGQKRFVRS